MNYIIDPKIFYWINVLDSIKELCIALSFVSFIAAVVSIVAILDLSDHGEKYAAKPKKYLKFAIASFVLTVLGMVFIPDKRAMIEMMIARTITEENLGLSIEAIKSVVDYIVQAAQAIK